MALCKRDIGVGVISTTMVAMMAMSILASTGVDSIDCPSNMVYPFWSTCFFPARYYGQEVYELSATTTVGNLAPEWDESNSTYYMRLADEGAKYLFTHLTREYRWGVSQSDNVLIQNVDTGRYLGWREEGEDEYFLVEGEGTTSFAFAKAESVSLPCPRIANARCEAYYIVHYSDPSVGLTAYIEDEVTYFKRSNVSGALPFVLLRSSNSFSSLKDIKMPIT